MIEEKKKVSTEVEFKGMYSRFLEYNFHLFNLNLFVLSFILLFCLSVQKGLLGIINFISIFNLALVFLLIYYLFVRKELRFIVVDVLFFVGIFINYIIGYLNLFFIRDSIAMGYKLGDVGLPLIYFFIKNIWGVGSFVFCLFIFFILIVFAEFLKKQEIELLPRRNLGKKILFIVLILIIIFSFLNYKYSSRIHNPYLNLFTTENFETEILIGENSFVESDYGVFHKDNFDDYDVSKRAYKYVFVFVMEQTSLNDFYREREHIQGDDFFEKVENKTHFFKNYYTGNQDSRTAVWAMLNSFYIPFECYIEPWQDSYGYILETSNLVDKLKQGGVEPYAVSSVGTGSLILGIYPFNQFIRFYAGYEEADEKYLCSTDFSYQKGCEDMAIFEDFTNHILENKDHDLFYLQEMIFGHGEKYMSLSGKTRTEYYNYYFDNFYKFLEENDLAKDSLIIIVSDHGPKGGIPRHPEDFNIPLMFISDKLEGTEIEGFYSHLSFKDIFFKYYLDEGELPEEEDLIYLVDQTGRNRRGYVDVENDYSLLGEVKENKLLLNNELVDEKIVQRKIDFLFSYADYVEKLSLENHTYKNIPGQ